MKRITKAEQRVVRAARLWFANHGGVAELHNWRCPYCIPLAKACAALAASRKAKK